MSLTESNNLALRTLEYWNLSSIRYGRIPGKQLTMETAINTTTMIEMKLGPQRRLSSSIRVLTESLILGRKKPNKKNLPPTNLISLAPPPSRPRANVSSS